MSPLLFKVCVIFLCVSWMVVGAMAVVGIVVIVLKFCREELSCCLGDCPPQRQQDGEFGRNNMEKKCKRF